MRIAVLLLLCATADAGVPKLPRHYAALFEVNHAWTYDVALTTWDFEHPGKNGKLPKKTDRSVVDCKVARTELFDAAFISEVTCSEAFPVAGVYAATAAGLFKIDEWPKTAADLPELGEPWVLSKPTAWHKKHHDTFFKADYTEGVRKQGLGWCVYSDTTQFADGGPVNVCFDQGIASALNDTGGELHRLEYKAR